jgi:hypothetical protein
VQVHIIEARELKAENLDGTSDPVVYVECFGQKQNTICIKQVRRNVLCPALLSIQAPDVLNNSKFTRTSADGGASFSVCSQTPSLPLLPA